MEITCTPAGDVTVVAISGEIDGQTASEAQQHISACIQDTSKLVLDMTEVGFLSSAGLRVLLGVYRQISQVNGRLAVTGLSDDIQETLNITGLLRYLPTFGTREEGIAALG